MHKALILMNAELKAVSVAPELVLDEVLYQSKSLIFHASYY